MKIKFLFYV